METCQQWPPTPVQPNLLWGNIGDGLVAKSRPPICDSVDYSLPDSSVHGIF